MSDTEEVTDEKLFIIEKAKNNRATCKKCKQKCISGEVRIAKLTHNPFGAGKMKNWHHVDCIFEVFLKQRPTTKRIENTDDMDGFDSLPDEDRKLIEEKIAESEKDIAQKYNLKVSPKKEQVPKPTKSPKVVSGSSTVDNAQENKGKDGLFREFRRLVADITNVSSYTEKTALVSKLFMKGSDGVKFRGDIKLWCRLLLPGVVKRVYNLQSKQLVKLFSKLFGTGQDEMLEHLENGDVSETIQHFFMQSKTCKPASKSLLTIDEVDKFLEQLSGLTKEDEQIDHFQKFITRCTINDLKVIIRLVKCDLKMNAGAKHILEGLHPDAYEVFQTSRDINSVIDRCLNEFGNKTSVKAKVSVMTPVLPMLAEACKSVEQAMQKCPNGMFSEIKYDGERVQVHKQGSEFRYYSRSLKPVMNHKISHFKQYIPEAFPRGEDLILDSEILMVDVNTGKPLPFGTLGKHKKNEFKDANVCLFVFDCMYYNGEDLTGKSLIKRKGILKNIMTEIPNRIVFAEMEEIHTIDDLKVMIAKVLKLGLEGLVLKDLKSTYEPGKRHWLKVKKDYLFGGAMADSADLIVLGAWYGTGKKGGMMSVFLMGCYDENTKRFCTVTKVHTGHDDKTLERLQDELDMIKISCDATKVPDWLHCTKTMIPDFVARDPEAQPVWEITGAEFTQHDVHTADGISLRFPRVTKIREDKDWKSATTLKELKHLFRESKENTDVSLLTKDIVDTGEGSSKKVKDKSPKRKTLDGSKHKKQKNNGNLNDLLASTSKKCDTGDSSPKDNDKNRKVTKRRNEEVNHDETKKQKKQKKDNNSPETSTEIKDSWVNVRVKIEDPLPDYFENIYLLTGGGSEADYKKWLRYFIAYGGNVISESEKEKATHMLHLKEEESIDKYDDLKNVVHVNTKWINDTICKGVLLDDKHYRVYLAVD